MKKKVCFFTVADDNNLAYAKMMENSLRKFHPTVDFVIIGQAEIEAIQLPTKLYLMTPLIGKRLIDEYELVVKIDADSVICGSLNHVIEDTSFDVACVLNSNPREFKSIQVSVWDIDPLKYVNCGFVAMRSEKFIEHWWKLCTGEHFNHYLYREQDLLNILYHYGDYQTKCLDYSNKWHGLVSKGYWPWVKLVGDKLVLPKNNEYPIDEDKEIVAIHWAGGQVPNKMNFPLHFQPDVVKRLNYLVSNGKEKETTKP